MKKIIAILVSLMLMASILPIAVLAAANETETDTGGGSALIPSISFTQKRVATLPTSVGFDFLLDPIGLYYLSDDEIEDLVFDPTGTWLGEMWDDDDDPDTPDVWRFLPSAGQIIFSDYSPYFINNSNFDVALEIAFSFDDGDDGDSVTAVATTTAVTTGTDANVLVAAVFAEENVSTAPTAFSGSLAIPILADEQSPVFLLDAAEYSDKTVVVRDAEDIIESVTVEQRFEGPEAGTGNGTQFTFYGKCNPSADWEAVFEDGDVELEISVKFALWLPAAEAWEFDEELDDLDIGDAIDGAYGLVEGNDLDEDSFIEIAMTSGSSVGFIVNGDVVSTLPGDGGITIARNVYGNIPFETSGKAIAFSTVSGNAPTAIGYNETDKVIWFQFTSAGFRNLKATVDGQDFEFWVSVS